MEPNELKQIKTALAVLATALLRMEYSKDCHHIAELEAIEREDFVKAWELTQERNHNL